MITDISNITSKSFKNYSSENKFGLTNVVFGTNGSGKSALTQWLKNQGADGVKLFDTSYVQNNIFAQDEIAGVKLTVGQSAVNIEENVIRIQEANSNIAIQGNQAKGELEGIKKQIFQFLDLTLKQAKEQFDLSRNINQKSNAKIDPISAYHQWLNDIDKNLDSSGSSKALEQEKSLLEDKLRRINTVFNLNTEQISSFISKMVEPLLVPSITVSDEIAHWITTGMTSQIHDMSNEQEICQFCGNEFNGPEISKIILAKTNNKHTKLVQELTQFKNKLIVANKSIINLSDDLQDLSVNDAISEIIMAIQSKVENTNQSIVIGDDVFQRLTDFDNALINKQKSLKEKVNEINKQLSQIERVAKSWIGTQLESNVIIQDLIIQSSSVEQKLKNLREIYKSNNKWILEQQQSNSDLKPFRDLINHEFAVLGLDFELVIHSDNQHYLIKHKNQDIIITTKDLSEGERRLLGFLHFYYDLFDKPDERLNANVELILIDDPITSLDSNNRYYLTELINKFIKQSIDLQKQLFILTHSSLDYHNFGYAQKSKIKYWKVNKNLTSHSELIEQDKLSLKNFSDYYQSNFKEVYQFAILTKKQLNVENFFQFGNKTRILLESHARSHYDIENVTVGSIDKLKECYEIPEKWADEFRRALDVINSLSHGMSFSDISVNDISISEVQRNVRFIIAILFKKDPFHVRKMVGSLYDSTSQKQWLERIKN